MPDERSSCFLVDTHAHIDGPEFDADRHEAIARAAASGVRYIVNFGDDMASSARSVALSEAEDAVFCGVGIHPNNAVSLTEEEEERLAQWSKHPKVIAIGEIGLDYYWEKDQEQRALQRHCFIRQLDLARQLHLPVCIHDREAHGDLLAILKKEGRENTGVIHCFSGSFEMARELLRLGWYLGVDGPVTYKNAAKLPDIVRRLPADRILLETDSPYLSPRPYRGKRNEPAFVRNTAEFVASLRSVSFATLAKQTTTNAHLLYGLF